MHLSFHIFLLSILFIFQLQTLQSESQKFELNQKLQKLSQIDTKIQQHKKLSFLNKGLLDGNFTNKIILNTNKGMQEKYLNEFKIRKYNEIKIDVNYFLKQIKNNRNQSTSQNNESQNLKKERNFVLQNLNFISTFGIPSKRHQGQLHQLNFLAINLFDKFIYSIEGQNVFTIEDQNNNISPSSRLSKSVKRQYQTHKSNILIFSVRNQYFFIAQYLYKNPQSTSVNVDCPSIKISQLQTKGSNKLTISQRPQFTNLLIQTPKFCQKNTLSPQKQYSQFFVHISILSRKYYYIFSTEQQIHFYFYSQKNKQLLFDQMRTIKLSQIYYEKQKNINPQNQHNDEHKIKKIIKLNTHLVVLTTKNKIFSINLVNYLANSNNNKKYQYLFLYETVFYQDQKQKQNLQKNYLDLKYNDADYRYFYLVTGEGIYRYRVEEYEVKNQYDIKEIMQRQQSKNQQNIKFEVFILENHIVLTPKKTNTKDNQQNKTRSKLIVIDKISSSFNFQKFYQQLEIPFIHEQKCHNTNKKVTIHKNKNSNYIVSLICFLKNDPMSYKNNKQSDSSSQNPISYIIFQNLLLQTSSQSSSASKPHPQDQQFTMIDFTRFRLPLIVFSLGIIFFVTFKKSSQQKSPQKQLQQQQMNKKFQEEIMQKINNQRQRMKYNTSTTGLKQT